MEFPNIILLTANNWEQWKVEIRVLLLHYGAWQFIEEPKTESAETSPKDSKTKVPETSETSDVASGKQVLSWREEYDLKLRKDRSYTLVYQSLRPEFKPLISQTTDVAEAWRILKNHFEPTTRARVIQLLDEFFNTRFETGEALGLFLCRVKQGAERLREVGHQLQPLYQGYQMIRSLPAEFLDQLGIRHEKTNPYSPKMNSVAKRFNLTALDGVKALLKSSGMYQKFWAEALLCFTYA
ncbi:hypothetical protein AVEN_39289-1 [Araneus ventricosus]|uniref:Integrase catalytic domain-containing protein n=1 Tax=Araneus ventricosus TaxID=182803 RepID=A0A4Y2S0L7_ARAVE|nr:hypothetical protein AVEN_39289-1 [Araneus ventricosus]